MKCRCQTCRTAKWVTPEAWRAENGGGYASGPKEAVQSMTAMAIRQRALRAKKAALKQ